MLQRRDGLVVGVDHDHVVLKNITEDLGKPVADLIIEKKREVEKYCPSGCYPTEVRSHGFQGKGKLMPAFSFD